MARIIPWTFVAISILLLAACSTTLSPAMTPPAEEMTAAPAVTGETQTTITPGMPLSPTGTAAPPAIITATVVPTTEVTIEVTTDVEEENVNRTASDVAALAQQDLAERLGIPVDQVEVREVRQVTWPDASLGCPQPGQVYAQVTQEGLLIRLSANGSMYFYHSGEAQQPFLCEQLSQIFPSTTPKADELMPPPGGEID